MTSGLICAKISAHEFQSRLQQKRDHSVFPGLVMMGFGQLHNFVKEKATPLWARAMFLENSEKKTFLYIHLEIAFVTHPALFDSDGIELRFYQK